MRSKQYASIIILIISITLGCSTVELAREGKNFNYDNEYKLEIGKTTKRDIAIKYGPPKKRSLSKYLEQYEYFFSRSLDKHMHPGVNAIPIVGVYSLITYGKKDNKEIKEFKQMLYYFNVESGKLEDCFYIIDADGNFGGRDESDTLYIKSIPYFSAGKVDEAVKLLESSISLRNNNHRSLNRLAWYYIDLDIDIDKGISIARKAIDYSPGFPYSYGTIGVGYFKKGDKISAEKYLKIYKEYHEGYEDSYDIIINGEMTLAYIQYYSNIIINKEK